MDEVLKALKRELLKAKDLLIQKDLRYAIYFTMKVIAQQKSNLKKEQKKLQKESREIEAEQTELLREIARKRNQLTRKV